MSQYLINIAVGPVQEFIASARKLRDLWYGSYLLSELSKSVARSLKEQGCDLIFPAIGNDKDLNAGSELNVANKILALSPDNSKPEKIVANARKAYSDFWQQICAKSLTRAQKIMGRQSIDEELFNRQTNDFGEFFAAWLEYDSANYTACREQCEKRLAGRKNLRDFLAPTWDGTGKPKSSLDGIRESVLQATIKKSHIIKQGEHLDALGIVKRFGPLNESKTKRPHFDNLAQVSAQPYLDGLRQASLEYRKIAELISNLPTVQELYDSAVNDDKLPKYKTSWDGWPEGLSSEILHPAVLEAELKNNQSASWQHLNQTLKDLWEYIAKPMPYCCLLVGDGDKMGETLNNLSTIAEHQQFSTELDNFARKVHPLLNDYQGQVVYSGGDDVMAYVPLHKALDCAKAINESFAESMKEAIKDTAIKKPPTFSMGMVIVHHHKPLHQILELARVAESHAKNKGDRNSLAIIQSKRSGADLTICGKWQKTTPKESSPLIDRMVDFADNFRQGIFSSRLGYQLRGIVKEFHGAVQEGEPDIVWADKDMQPGNVISAEIVRILSRKRQQSGDKLTAEETAKLLAGQNNLRQVSDELIIAHQISQAMSLAAAESFKIKEKTQ